MNDTPEAKSDTPEAKSDTPEAKTAKLLTSKRAARVAGKIAAGSDAALVRKRKGKLAITLLRQIADGNAENPQALARAFFKGARGKVAKDENTGS